MSTYGLNSLRFLSKFHLFSLFPFTHTVMQILTQPHLHSYKTINLRFPKYTNPIHGLNLRAQLCYTEISCFIFLFTSQKTPILPTNMYFYLVIKSNYLSTIYSMELFLDSPKLKLSIYWNKPK